MINNVIRYFDLYSQYRLGAKGYAGESDRIALWRQLLIYFGCVVGIVLGPFIPTVLAGNTPSPSEILVWSKLFWATILAFVILAGTYKLIFDPDKPFIVQVSYAVVLGFCVEKIAQPIIDAILKCT